MPQRRLAAGTNAEEARQTLLQRFGEVRERTVRLTRHLEPEDMVLQSMPDASPVRWHLAHTTWFFETFILGKFARGYEPYHSSYCHLFNSYYESVGSRWPRDQRGLLSRPTATEILDYRRAVEEKVADLIGSLDAKSFEGVRPLLALGLHHEEQHQELLCTDIKSAFALSPLAPAVLPLPESFAAEPAAPSAAANERWVSFEGGLRSIGFEGEGFAFDNEGPRHQRFLQDFALHGTPVTNGAYLEFLQDGGYQNPLLWLSDGWAWLQEYGIEAPVYWRERDGEWFEVTMHGLLPLRRDRILCHVSAYEAFAFAEWAKARLPREEELEIALERDDPSGGQFLDPEGFIHPHLAGRDQALGSAYGTVWDWTQSSYSAYPGFRPAPGAVGEYNGKFMSGQLVLKGGSCATPPGHVRASYRNFFPPDARWQFTGIRLAKDL
ncbi:ergothioneine biosynthesis protein EgtB [Parvularcula maris]|uniref:Ergothioneine biosynthesis protein EgtB n=1 Tax=Parvularcula maris TaxID=2965077 RepID=A0A9X2L7N5_9PROT|nr:ergothioneine biosynthesis protein EgtB [Parvularcula maris]MCQ8184449.1 ergothioneine biosynthesis protein EgtB [Parvularcula maris]